MLSGIWFGINSKKDSKFCSVDNAALSNSGVQSSQQHNTSNNTTQSRAHYLCLQDENEVYSKANIVLGKVCEYLYDNQLHINKEKTCFMHFHPRLNSKSRLTCARIRPHGSEFTLNLGDKKVKKGTMLNF